MMHETHLDMLDAYLNWWRKPAQQRRLQRIRYGAARRARRMDDARRMMHAQRTHNASHDPVHIVFDGVAPGAEPDIDALLQQAHARRRAHHG